MKKHNGRSRGGSRTRSKGSAMQTPPLRMTSMMDILVVLLLFLIKSFVVDSQMMPAAGVDLPKSSSEETPEESLVIAILGDEILIGEERVASVSEAESSALHLEPLAVHLVAIRSQQEEIARLRGETEFEPGRVTIQGDRDIEFQLLQKVMYTLGEHGYSEISLAVIRSASA